MTSKNHHFRELPSHCYNENRLPPEFHRFFEATVSPLLNLEGYKLAERAAIAVQIIHNLVMTGLVGACVADSRDDRVRFRRSVWDCVVGAGLARMCLGSQKSGRVTRYRATGKLLELRREWELRLLLDLTLARNTDLAEPTPSALVYVHTGKVDPATGRLLADDEQKQPISIRRHVEKRAQRTADGKPDPAAIENGLAYFRDVEDCLEQINRSNLSHSWQAFRTDPKSKRAYVFQPNPCLRQIHVGDFFRAVRLYSWSVLSGQQLSKGMRRTMLVDGEQVAELDFSGMATRMLYHFAGCNPKGDVYRPKRIMPAFHSFANASPSKRAVVRDFVKKATNICWNVADRSKANSAIGRLLTEHKHSDFLRPLVYQTENTDAAGILDRIIDAHPRLHNRFFTEVGLDLMTTDGRIMLRILKTFADAGRPALGIHDAVVCRKSDVTFAQEAMTESYRQFFQFDPVIKRTF